MAASLHRQSSAFRHPQPVLPYRGTRRTLRNAGAATRRHRATWFAHNRYGVRLGDGRPRGPRAAGDRRTADQVPPAGGRIEAVKFPRRLAPSSISARPQSSAPVLVAGRADGWPWSFVVDHGVGKPQPLWTEVVSAYADRRHAAAGRWRPGHRDGALRTGVRDVLPRPPSALVRRHPVQISP